MPVVIFAPETRYLSETTRMIDCALALPSEFESIFMSYGGQYEQLIKDKGFEVFRLEPQMTAARSNKMFRIEHLDTLGYLVNKIDLEIRLEYELELFKRFSPCCVVTGFIHSTAVSTQLYGIPLLWVTPATLSKPYFDARLGVWPDVLDFPIINWLPDFFLNWWTNRSTTSSALLFRPFNQVCKKRGLKRFKSLPHMLATGYALLSDIPELVGVDKLPENYRYVGPFITRLDIEIPEEIQNMPKDLPIVYFAMGSSGKPRIIQEILEGFAGKPYRVIAPVKHLLEGKRAGKDFFGPEEEEKAKSISLAGSRPGQLSSQGKMQSPKLKPNRHKTRQLVEELMIEYGMGYTVPENVIVTDWLPAHKVNPLADVSVIHGGQGTVYNALASGTPVVGVGMQPEQEGNLECLVRHGIGIRIRKKRVTAQKVLAAIDTLLADPKAKQKAMEFQKLVAAADGPTGVAKFIMEKFL